MLLLYWQAKHDYLAVVKRKKGYAQMESYTVVYLFIYYILLTISVCTILVSCNCIQKSGFYCINTKK